MTKSKELLTGDIPVRLEMRYGGGNRYSTNLWFGYDGGASDESVTQVMTALGKQARGVLVNRVALDYIEVVTGKMSRLRRTVAALIRELKPLTVEVGFGQSRYILRETIYPAY